MDVRLPDGTIIRNVPDDKRGVTIRVIHVRYIDDDTGGLPVKNLIADSNFRSADGLNDAICGNHYFAQRAVNRDAKTRGGANKLCIECHYFKFLVPA